MSTPHVSDFAFDRLITRELDGSAEGEQHRAHLAACATCAARYAKLVRDAAAFRRRAPLSAPATAARPLRRSARSPARRFRYAIGTLVAAAAALILFVRAGDDPDVRRMKGGLQLEVLVKHREGAVEQLLSGGTARPGEALRFRLSTPRAGFVALVSIDGAGAVSSYLPAAPRLSPIAAASGQLLDGSIELDGTLGKERLIALVCERSLPTAEVLERARAALAEAHGQAQAIDPEKLGLACSHTSFWFDKAAPP